MDPQSIAEYPWPDRPVVGGYVVDEEPLLDEDDDDEPDWSIAYQRKAFEPPSDHDIHQQNILMLRRQCLFRWAAQAIAIAFGQLPEVRRVTAFGAVAQPLKIEIPRFSQFRRHRIAVLHECADLDLAVWMTDLSELKKLKNPMSRGLSLVNDTAYGGVAHHQVDVHLLEAGNSAYRGRLCIFGQCPKPGKDACLVRGRGAQPFLQQFERFQWNSAQFGAAPKVILFDRGAGFVVRPPVIRPF